MSEWLTDGVETWGSERVLVFRAAARVAGLYGPLFCIASSALVMGGVVIAALFGGLDILAPPAPTIFTIYFGALAAVPAIGGAFGTYLIGAPVALLLLKVRAIEWPMFLFAGFVCGAALAWVVTGSLPLRAAPKGSSQEDAYLIWVLQNAVLFYMLVYTVLGRFALARVSQASPRR